jgi:tripartite-type tricarboxylate transporter receptor subunit TctC
MFMCKSTTRIVTALGLALAICWSSPALSQFSAKPITIVVPYAAGGGTDITARLIAKRLGENLGQAVIVDNKPGAGGSIGTAAVAKAAPDGHTLLLGNPGPNAINPHLYPKLPYDAEKDFAPVALLTTLPLVFCVAADSPVKTMADLVALGKSRAQANYGSSGNGSVSHLGTELLNMATGTKFTHVPYKGAAPMSLALLSGEVQLGLVNGIDALPYLASGKLRALAIPSAARSSVMPDVPTTAEAGFPDVRIDMWYGLLAPAKTPRPVIDRLHAELAKILAEPAVKSRLAQLGSSASPSTPEEFAARIRTELAKFAEVVKVSGAKIE